jgi:hypothetical protein
VQVYTQQKQRYLTACHDTPSCRPKRQANTSSETTLNGGIPKTGRAADSDENGKPSTVRASFSDFGEERPAF